MKFRPPFMVQTSLKHQEKPSEYLIYSPLLHIMTYRPPCSELAKCRSPRLIRQMPNLILKPDPIILGTTAARNQTCRQCFTIQKSINTLYYYKHLCLSNLDIVKHNIGNHRLHVGAGPRTPSKCADRNKN